MKAEGYVYPTNGNENRQLNGFPRKLEDYGLPIAVLPNPFPKDWIYEDSTIGNSNICTLSVRPHRRRKGGER